MYYLAIKPMGLDENIFQLQNLPPSSGEEDIIGIFAKESMEFFFRH